MEQEKVNRLRKLNDQLNQYRHEYYNLNAPTVSDATYDLLFDELAGLEKETGIQMANSPTRTVGWPAVSKLEKTIHITPCCPWTRQRAVRICFHSWTIS